ncbi:guanylate kinase [Desulfolutivibrio sulfoxidireducens]|uniref:guanylate kinase n=1 Tax=Desulfolutivibrio sulfoxidireducens TaxID=2773299 RepID=UPI00159CF3E7|nr:guanylate kinase [Desulfolutivibrio sulfoxidireducens]QLA15354.1 guanylate kinase [Desulfolutivibrio sulfoxidireducens]QLA18933.1 guanylate kinase [Desulfolutivibrio sulfoxidireducens]
MRRLGLLFVVSAPSGAGKSTLLAALRKEFPELTYSVSATTRAPRPGEVDGRDYHFLSEEAFLRLRDTGHFAEWARVHGNFYGTPMRPVIDLLSSGKDVLFDIDVAGADQLRQVFEEGTYVFILPPSRAELARRLGGRGTESPETLAKRLKNAAGEISQAGRFDFWVVNDDLDRATDHLRAVYLAARARPRLFPGLVEELLAQFD